jgi:hypothetical protein
VSLTVASEIAHALAVTASASPSTVLPGGMTSLSATGTDSLGHTITDWSWSDAGAGGTFLPSSLVRDPTYRPAANLTRRSVSVPVTVTARCGDAIGTAQTRITVKPTRRR